MKCDKCETRCDSCGEALSIDDQAFGQLKPIQIIPAPGWRAMFSDPDGREYGHQLIAWALTEGGSVLPLVIIDPDESASDPRDEGDFSRLKHTDDEKDPE